MIRPYGDAMIIIIMHNKYVLNTLKSTTIKPMDDGGGVSFIYQGISTNLRIKNNYGMKMNNIISMYYN